MCPLWERGPHHDNPGLTFLVHLWFAQPNWDVLAGATAVGDPTSTREVQAVEAVLTPE